MQQPIFESRAHLLLNRCQLRPSSKDRKMRLNVRRQGAQSFEREDMTFFWDLGVEFTVGREAENWHVFQRVAKGKHVVCVLLRLGRVGISTVLSSIFFALSFFNPLLDLV